MDSNAKCIPVQIVRFVDEHFPGWVECEFVDAGDRKHRLIDKVPVFTTELLDAASSYPRRGIVRCEILARVDDAEGRELVRITIARPDTVESTEGLSEFVVLATQLRDDPWSSPATRDTKQTEC